MGKAPWGLPRWTISRSREKSARLQPARDFPAGGGHFPGKECLFHRGKPEFWVKFQHCVVGKKIDEVNGSPIYLEDAFHQVPGEPPAPEIRAGHDRPQLDHGKGAALPAKRHPNDRDVGYNLAICYEAVGLVPVGPQAGLAPGEKVKAVGEPGQLVEAVP